MKAELLSDIKKQISKLQAIESLVERLPDLSDVPGVKVRASQNNVTVEIPFDWSLYREVRRRFKGWKRDNYWVTTQYSTNNEIGQHATLWPDDGRRLYFQGPYVSVVLRTEREGSICRLEQVGTKEVPQYKVVCQR